MSTYSLPTYFLSHGIGPWPWMKDNMPGVFDELERTLKIIPVQLAAKPKAILVISGHWEEDVFTVMATPKPPMIYDYSGFPSHTYHIKYPASGDPALAIEIYKLLLAADIEVKLDSERGFDHGVYAVTYPLYPNADVPVLQLSIRSDYSPEAHIKVGHALASLRKQGVLIVGSGGSYHNLRMPKDAKEQSIAFDEWLQDAAVKSAGKERSLKLVEWLKAPFARAAHPNEDHLIPLMVAAGAAEDDPGVLVYHEMLMDRAAVSSFQFGEYQ